MVFRIKIASLCLFLISGVIAGHGQATVSGKESKAGKAMDTVLQKARNDVRKNIQASRRSRPDSIPAIRREALKLPDSAGVSYENGNLTLPGQLSSPRDNKALKDQAENILKRPEAKFNGERVVDQLKSADVSDQITRQKTELPDLTKTKARDRIGDRSDSLQQWARKGEDILDQARDGVPEVNKIYSQRSLKRIYDSLGVSKLDSALALASSKREVSKEELLQAINLSFPDSTPSTMTAPSASELLQSPEATSIKDGLPAPDLSSMKLPAADLQGLPPVRGFQMPSDSLPLLDSLRKLNLKREGLTLREEELSENVKGALFEKKTGFWDRAYFEGVLSYFKDKDLSSFQASPSLGYSLKGNLSVGIGPNILINRNGKHWDVQAGYRSFVKYQIFSQRAYLQVEDIVEPRMINSESARHTQHSVLAGAGYLQRISRVMALNFCVLYRVNNRDYSGGSTSPWIVRLGISSIGSGKKDLK